MALHSPDSSQVCWLTDGKAQISGAASRPVWVPTLRQLYTSARKPFPWLAIMASKSSTRRVHVHGAHAIEITVRRGERLDALLEFTGQIQQPAARRDDREVAGAEVLLAAVVDGAHAFLYRTVLVVDAPDSGVAHSALDLAVEQIVVLHVALRR